jgi:hypothetical protein
MANFAQLDLNNKVINVLVADTKEVVEQITQSTCIEYTDENPAYIDWTWDGTNFISPTTIEENN